MAPAADSADYGFGEADRAAEDSDQDCSYEDGDDAIARFLLEADVEIEDPEVEEQPSKRQRIQSSDYYYIESGDFEKIPPELFRNILKFLSSEDLSSCAKACQYLRRVASDGPLWRRLYCLRWGLPVNPCNSAEWKQLYFERDKADVVASMSNAPVEFKEYYMQMQVAKRTQAPLPSQIKDDFWEVDQSISDQVTAFKRSRGLADNYIGNHICSGENCSYHQIGDVYICEKTGCAHVCGDACRETVLDPNCLHVCTVSGRCFDPCVFPVEEEETEGNPQQAAAEEAEIGAGSLARAFSMGYSGYRFEKALRIYSEQKCTSML